jgi:hypothetical protein
MYATDLIRHHAGTEIPAAGAWELPSSHVSIVAEARPRARARSSDRARAPVGRGLLAVGDEAASTSLTLTIRPAADDAALGQLLDGNGGELVLHVSGLAPNQRGEWNGRAHVENAVQCWPASLEVDYRGVYPRGQRAVAWFVLRCQIVTEASRRLRRRRSIDVRVDLLALAPVVERAALAA